MNIISTEDLRKKEIINLCNGASIGFAENFEFDKCTYLVVSLIVEKKTGFLGIFGSEKIIISVDKIDCIGEDTILVRLPNESDYLKCRTNKKGFFKQ